MQVGWDVSCSNKQDHCEVPSGCLRSFSLGAAAQGVQPLLCIMSLYMDPIKEVKTVSKQCVRCWKVELLPHTVSWDFVFTDICVSVSLAPGKDGIFRFISLSLAPHYFLLSFWLTWLPWSQRNSWNAYCDFWDILLLLELCLTLFIQQKKMNFWFFKETHPSHLSVCSRGH